MPPRAATLPLLIVQGDWEETRELAEITRADGSPLERQMAITILGHLAQRVGDSERAWQMVRELLPRGPASEPEDGLFPYAIQTLRLAAQLALDESNLRAAHEWLQTHDRWLDWSGAVRGRADSELLRARLSILTGDYGAAREHALESVRLAGDPRQPLVLLEGYETLGQIALNSGSIDEAESHFTEALALADACAAPYQRSRILLLLAGIEQSRAHESRSRELLTEARTIAEALGARPLLSAIDHRESVPAPLQNGLSDLTARELDVLRLVAQGLTDAEVAERLYISRRTVSQHLRSVYNKLGVSSRAAATRIAVEDDLV